MAPWGRVEELRQNGQHSKWICTEEEFDLPFDSFTSSRNTFEHKPGCPHFYEPRYKQREGFRRMSSFNGDPGRSGERIHQLSGERIHQLSGERIHQLSGERIHQLRQRKTSVFEQRHFSDYELRYKGSARVSSLTDSGTCSCKRESFWTTAGGGGGGGGGGGLGVSHVQSSPSSEPTIPEAEE